MNIECDLCARACVCARVIEKCRIYIKFIYFSQLSKIETAVLLILNN